MTVLGDLLTIASGGDRKANKTLWAYYNTSNLDKQRDHLKICVNLGCIDSIRIYTDRYMLYSNPLRAILYGKIAKRHPALLVHSLNSFHGSTKWNFIYGRYLKGHIDQDWNRIYGCTVLHTNHISLAQSLVNSYDKLLKESIKSIDAWSLCAKHYLGVCKDIRLLIARLLWYDAYEWTNSLDGL
jgi:hypothetical protein